jgi:hypothetical protein
MTIKFLSVHRSMKHSQQETFLQLSAAQFLELLLQVNAETFVTLKFVYPMIFVGLTGICSTIVLVIKQLGSNKCTS